MFEAAQREGPPQVPPLQSSSCAFLSSFPSSPSLSSWACRPGAGRVLPAAHGQP